MAAATAASRLDQEQPQQPPATAATAGRAGGSDEPQQSRTASAVELQLSTVSYRVQKIVDYPGIDALFYALTVAVFAASLVTDLFVVIEHWFNTYKSWAYFTIGLVFVPSCFVQMLSLKWYQASGKLKQHQWISHIFHLAIMHRFCFLLNYAIKTMKTQASSQQRDCIFRVENDAFTLNLFTALLVSVPQIIFQIYVMTMLQHISFWTSASVVASLCSLTWALTSYSLLANRGASGHDESQFTWSSMMVQGFWRGGMLAARIAALVLAAISFQSWLLLIFGIHTLGMTIWIVQETTNFCSTAMDELAYKCLIGTVYFFDFLRVSDNQVRYHVCLFYTVLTFENAAFYGLYLLYFKGHYQANVLIVSSVMVLGGSFIGAVSMFMHFCMFQNIKTIKLCKRVPVDPELSLKLTPTKSIGSKSPSKKWNKLSSKNESAIITPDTTADKKSLLTNIVQNNESVEKGIVNSSFAKSDETNVTVQVIVEDSKVTNVDVLVQKQQNHLLQAEKNSEKTSCNVDLLLDKITDQVKNTSTDSLHRQKRRGICSELELDLKPDECNIELDSQLSLQKRRGICSLTQLGLELVTDEDNYVEKSFSLDKLKSNSEMSLNVEDKSLDSGIIDSLPIKSLMTDNCKVLIPENILARGRLNTPVTSETGETTINAPLSEKEGELRKQEEETMSHVTSIHDYENLCPLGVARPPWCIRSWKGYTDIETYIHDDSVVRDRRRDTLTSTATGTTLSSDFSDATYTSLPLRKLIRRSRQDDYLDTLIYDLVDWESISNSRPPVEDVSTTTTSESIEESQEQSNSLFSAKPIVIDERGGMLALDTILEEHEDLGLGLPEQLRLGKPPMVSSLVATIDEIRRCAAENSPRHVYHRTESQWEDLEQKIFMRRSHLAKVLFANNEVGNVRLGCSTELEAVDPFQASSDRLSIIREMTKSCLGDVSGRTPLINAILSDSPILGPKTDAQPCEAEHLIEENNVYVDMNALGAQKCSSEEHMEADNCHTTDKDVLLQSNSALAQSKDSGFSEKRVDGCTRKKVAFCLTDEVINDSASEQSGDSPAALVQSPVEPAEVQAATATTELPQSTTVPFSDRRRHAANRPRRKFSLLRERFEPPKPGLVQLNCSLNNKLIADEKPETPDGPPKSPSKLQPLGLSDNLKEKRSVFLKQVLSPPRFQGWGKKRTFSPNAKIIPKAH